MIKRILKSGIFKKLLLIRINSDQNPTNKKYKTIHLIDDNNYSLKMIVATSEYPNKWGFDVETIYENIHNKDTKFYIVFHNKEFKLKNLKDVYFT